MMQYARINSILYASRLRGTGCARGGLGPAGLGRPLNLVSTLRIHHGPLPQDTGLDSVLCACAEAARTAPAGEQGA